jgi:polar amino acid transport system permease protein
MPFMTILVLYFALASLISFGMRKLERHLGRGLDGVRA